MIPEVVDAEVAVVGFDVGADDEAALLLTLTLVVSTDIGAQPRIVQ